MDDKKFASSDEKAAQESQDMTPAEAPSLIGTQPGRPAAGGAPKSQALLDIEADAGEGGEPEKKDAGSKTAPQNLVSIARFRWIILFILSLASLVFWAAEAQVSDRPYKFIALGYLAVSLILTIPTMKFLRIPTRGGLAALLWAGTFSIAALQGPDETLFNGQIPAALPWGGLLVLILIWLAVAVWRKVGRYKVIDIVLGLIILYAALSPLLALVDNITAGNVLFLKFQTLNASPAFLTRHLPWLMWPMTVVLALALPLCALFALWDQLSVLKRRGARHGGDIFLALAFLLLIPYGFLSYGQAVSELPETAQTIRSLYPLAAPAGDAAALPLTGAPEISIEELPPPAVEPLTEPVEEPEAFIAPAAPETAAPPENPVPPAPETAPALPAGGPEAADRTMALENELNAAKDKINRLEDRLERLNSEVEQMKRGIPPIPAPPGEPPAPLERIDEEPGLSSTT